MSSPIEKLQKFLKLEIERGYDNRAVVGGLDKILPTWRNEAQSQNIDEQIIKTVEDQLTLYREQDLETRESTLHHLRGLLDKAKSDSPKLAQPDIHPTPPNKPTASSDGIRVRKKHRQHDAPQLAVSTPSKKVRNVNVHYTDSPANIGLNAPLTVIPGIGNANANSLKSLGLKSLGDLLYYFPRRYDNYSELKPISRLEYGDEVTIIGGVQSIIARSIHGGKKHVTEAVLSDGTGYIRVTWFNQPYLTKTIKPNMQIVLAGKVSTYLGRLVINSPDWEPLEQEHLNTNRIVPVYPLRAGITNRKLRKIISQTVETWAPRLTDHLSNSLRNSAQIIDLPNALLQIHFPDSMEKLKAARDRLAFDEIFLLQLGVLKQKKNWQTATAQVFEISDETLEQKINSLSFKLTNAQIKTLNDVRRDLSSGNPMNRLIQGDVGSGKTVVAALTAAIIMDSGAQAAILAPTSILAEQHFRSFQKILAINSDSSESLQPEQIALLIGDTPEAEKQTIRAALKDGTIKLIIGTHALLQDPVEFQRLQLAVIDEQHRFGVEQRAMLRAKGENPHLLVMTATPIPRSLSLTLYGDLDLSIIDEMPAGRQPIETHILHPLERERAYQLIRSHVKQGQQAFIVYPLVEGEDVDEGKAAVQEHQRLQNEIFPNLRLGLLHGRLKPEEKDEVMNNFRSGKYDLLVSTSVVEVGVDVPNATVMLIEGANRFGLSQLHQFRGRVGRGAEKSYCLLIPETEDDIENERLLVMAETNDGFVLAERDLEQRGPGDFLGTRQSGFSELKLAAITDVHLIEKARRHAEELFDHDPDLSAAQNLNLAKMVDRFWGINKGDIS